METASFSPTLQDQSLLLARALCDPQVVTLAGLLHLDLGDPITRNGLLAMAQQCVDQSLEIDTDSKLMFSRTLTPGQSRYGRNATRSYREIAAMH
ncbi:MAG: hypothetical protein ACOYNZ_08315 [Rhodoferax sp.]